MYDYVCVDMFVKAYIWLSGCRCVRELTCVSNNVFLVKLALQGKRGDNLNVQHISMLPK